MNAVELPEWPVVTVNDDGIRPAGKPDECFYCHSRVGQRHGYQCVMVEKRVYYRVLLMLPNGFAFWGTWSRMDPYHWTRHGCEFHKNESSWCAGNAEGIVWEHPQAEALLEAAVEDDGCECSLLEFTYDREEAPEYQNIPEHSEEDDW